MLYTADNFYYQQNILQKKQSITDQHFISFIIRKDITAYVSYTEDTALAFLQLKPKSTATARNVHTNGFLNLLLPKNIIPHV